MSIVYKDLGLKPYLEIWQTMKDFTNNRNATTSDEIWFCEHPPVFTTGCRNSSKHIIKEINSIPVIQTDRGGLITYHGPNQIMVYALIDLKRKKLGIRKLVQTLQKIIIDTLKEFTIESYGDDSRPGVFIKLKNNDEAKICSIGLRVSNGKTYHGLCLNYDMDLSPFNLINPCGFEGLKMTNIQDLIKPNKVSKNKLIEVLSNTIYQKLN